jgi:GTP-binding protein Era
MTKSGYVAIIGKPNVGKSTFINAFIGETISIITRKAQTTRDKILAVYTDEDTQIIFLDSPGIHISQKEINQFMLKEAISAIKDADLVLFLVEYNNSQMDKVNKKILDYIFSGKKPIILLINKIDKYKSPAKVLEAIDFWKKQADFDEIIPISAFKGFNQKLLLKEFKKYLPQHPFYYPIDFLTDKDERFIVSELIREQILLLTHEEIPYDSAVVIDKFLNIENKVTIDATIVLARESQKRVILGNKGSMIKKIRENAQEKAMAVLGRSVKLKLFVKIDKNWSTVNEKIEKLGYSNQTDLSDFL